MSQDTRPDVVSIPRAEYNQLLRAKEKLGALESMGVDNWDGYSDAMTLLQKPEPTPAVDVTPEPAAAEQTEEPVDAIPESPEVAS